MNKIFEIDEKDILTGKSTGSQVQDRGLWHKLEGMNPFYNAFTESDELGLLQACPQPTDLTSTVVDGIPWDSVSDAANQYVYISDTSGGIYTIDTSTGGGSPVNLRDAGNAIASPAAGLGILQPKGGSVYFLYAQLTQIGRVNLTTASSFPTSYTAGEWTDNWSTGLQSTQHHAMHIMFDEIYYLNKDRIGRIKDDGANDLTNTTNVLDLPADYEGRAISDDGIYIVVGMTKNNTSNPTVKGATKIIFWNRTRESWQREYEIPSANILSIKKVGGVMVAITSRGVYSFTFDSAPVPVLPILSTDNTPNPARPTQKGADVINDAIVWGGDGFISTLGKISPAVPGAHFQPFSGFTGQVTMIETSARLDYIWIGTQSSKLYRVATNGADTTRETGISPETIYIDLKQWYQVRLIVLEFEGQLASGDEINIDVGTDSLTSTVDWGTASFSSHGAIRTKELYGSVEARKLKIVFNFNGGAVRIRRVSVHGYPIRRPTHTRV